MNPSPSHIASPIPTRSAITPFQAALAAQICALTQAVDDLESTYEEVNCFAQNALDSTIATLHSAIDALNALYEASLNEASENRRAKWLLRDILRDLPANKDWLDPDTERAARALIGH